MAEGFELGKAFIKVDPNTEGFKEKLKADLDKDKTELKVKVSPDTTGFKQKMEADLKKNRSSVKVKAEADTKDFSAKLDEVVHKRRVATVDVRYNKSQVDSLGSDAGGAFSKGFGNAVQNGGGGGGGGGAAFLGGAKVVSIGAGIASGVTAALAVLPAATAAIGSASGIALGDAFLMQTVKVGKKMQPLNAAFVKQQTTFMNSLKLTLAQSAAPLIKPLESAFRQITGWFPKLKSELGGVFSALGPQVLPMIQGLEGFANNFLPRLATFLKAATGPLNLFWQGFAQLGKYMGMFLTNMGPGMMNSMKVLVSVLGDLGRLFAFIGKQASIAANVFGGSIITAFRELTNLAGTLLKWVVQIGGALMPFWATLSHALSGLLNHLMPLIMPILKDLVRVVDQLIVTIMPFLNALFRALQPLIAPLLKIVDLFLNLGMTILGQVLRALMPLLPILSKILLTILVPLTKLLQSQTNQQIKMFGQLMLQLSPLLVSLAQSLLKVVIALMPLIDLLIKVQTHVMSFELVIISHVIPVLAKFIKAIAQLIVWIAEGIGWFAKWASSARNWQHVWSDIVNWLHGTWARLVNWLHSFWSQMINYVHSAWAAIANNTHAAWSAVLNWLHSTWSTIANTAHAFWSRMVNDIHAAWSHIANDTHSIWSAIANWLHSMWSRIMNDLHKIWSNMANLVHSFWSAIMNDTHSVWSHITNWLHSSWSGMANDVHHIWSGVANDIHSFWSRVANDTKAVWSSIVNWISHTLPGMMGHAFEGVTHAIGTVWNGLKAIAATPINWVVDHVSAGVDTITNALSLGKPLSKFEHFRMAGGGVVPGYAPGHDVYNAKLSPGEGVLVPEAVQAVGPGTIHALNKQYGGGRKSTVMGGKGHFAGGGINPIGAIGHAVSGAAHAVGNVAGGVFHDIGSIAKMAWNTITDPVGEATKVLNGIIAHNVPGVGIGLKMAEHIGKRIIDLVVNDIIAGSGGGSGAAIAAAAQKWNGHKYVWGGPANPTSGWDCSSFASYILGTNGIALPGGFTVPSGTHGPATGNYLAGYGKHKAYSAMAPGDLYVSGSHMGIVIGPGKGFAARSTATGTGPQNVNPGVYNIITPPGLGAGGGRALGANFTSANAMSVGREMFSYLQAAAHMTPIAAAGAIASIYGESGWNPESAGTGGRGLIGWTPPGTLPNAAFTGNAVHDLNAQLPEIIRFIGRSGDWGVISRMNQASSILEAANLWGHGVERFGINDVHGPGLALAAQIMGSGRGIKGINAMAGNPTPLKPGHFATGTDGAPSGWAWVGEEGPELVDFTGGETVLDADTSSVVGDAMGNVPGYAKGTKKPTKAQIAAQKRHAGVVARQRQRHAAAAARHAAVVARHAAVLARQQAAKIAKAAKAANTYNTDYSHILEAMINLVKNADTGNVSAVEKEDLKIVKAMDKMFATKWDHAIEKSFAKPLTKQTNALIAIANRQAAVQARMAQISGYATSVAGNLTGYADASNITLGNVVGAPSQGRQITMALQANLGQLKTFAKALKGAAKKGINTAFLQQAIAMGPGQGTQYLNAVASSGVGNIKALNAVYKAIGAESTLVGQQAADTVYGVSGTGKNFLGALKRQSAALTHSAEVMGITMARTLHAELSRLAKAPKGLSADIAQILTQDIAAELRRLKPKKRARGGSFNANDLLLVGEEGPELASFGSSGTIINNANTKSMMSKGGANVQIAFYGTQYPNNEQIQNLIHEMSLALEVN